MTAEEHLKEIINNLNQRISEIENNGVPGVRDFFATSALSILANDFWTKNVPAEVIAAVITSYSIHYTKLYEVELILKQAELEKRRGTYLHGIPKLILNKSYNFV